MVNEYNPSVHPSDDYLDALRAQHHIVYLYDECEECYQRYVINEEPRPADGYVCDLLDGCYCLCYSGLDLTGDVYDYERECTVYLDKVKEYLS